MLARAVFGVSRVVIDVTVRWPVTRMVLHRRGFTPATQHGFQEFGAAVLAFLQRVDLPVFHPSTATKVEQSQELDAVGESWDFCCSIAVRSTRSRAGP